MPLLKKLAPVGNSLALVIPKAFLDQAGIDRDTEVEIASDGVRIVLIPRLARGAKRAGVSKLIDEVLERHHETLKKLSE